MKIKIAVTFLVILCSTIATYAQPNCNGKLSNDKEDEKYNICFKRITNPINNYTKYTFDLKNEDIFEVNFEPYMGKDEDSISIQFIDKKIDRMERRFVKIRKKDSHVIIKNYKVNEENINEIDSTYSILFSIDTTSDYFITLYQFKAPTRTELHFYLQQIQQSVLNKHYGEVSAFKRGEQRKKEIADRNEALKNKMIEYKEMVLQSIITQEMNISNRVANEKAPDILQKDFTKTLNVYFNNIFSNVFPFTNEEFQEQLTFECKGNGKITIDPNKMFTTTKKPTNNWILDSFNLKIKPLIENANYPTIAEPKNYPKLTDDFMNWFEENIKSYEAYRSEFENTIRKIQNEFSPYQNPERKIPIPTKYTYLFKYESVLKKPTWRIRKSGGGKLEISDKTDKNIDKVEIDENITQQLNDKYSYLTQGKYDFSVCFLTINGEFIDKKIKLISRK